MMKLSSWAATAALFAGLAVAAPAGAADAGATRFRAVKVDTSHVAANGAPQAAGWAQSDLAPELAASLAPVISAGDRRAPTLVVHINEIALGTGDGMAGMAAADVGRARDSISGTADVVGADGRTIASYPLISTLFAFTGGSQREMGTERGRVADLSRSLAAWLPGQIGL
jgi:hypothetical protein